MQELELKACAKLNLALDILGKRSDGYHELRMVMQSVTLEDTLRVVIGTGEETRVATNLPYLPTNQKNLAAAAALRFQEDTGRDLGGVSVTIDKAIPVCAGLAGGSTDAAAVLRALNTLTGAGYSPEELARIGWSVGSDVAYCVLGGTALARGRGEELTPLPALPHCHAVLCKPGFALSTPVLFSRADGVRLRCRPDIDGMLAALNAGDLRGVAQRMYNVFEDVLEPRQHRIVEEIKQTLISAGALGASMSGSGPTVFGLFDGREAACAARELLYEDFPETFLVETV